jgi:hypothetical protein
MDYAGTNICVFATMFFASADWIDWMPTPVRHARLAVVASIPEKQVEIPLGVCYIVVHNDITRGKSYD